VDEEGQPTGDLAGGLTSQILMAEKLMSKIWKPLQYGADLTPMVPAPMFW